MSLFKRRSPYKSTLGYTAKFKNIFRTHKKCTVCSPTELLSIQSDIQFRNINTQSERILSTLIENRTHLRNINLQAEPLARTFFNQNIFFGNVKCSADKFCLFANRTHIFDGTFAVYGASTIRTSCLEHLTNCFN